MLFQFKNIFDWMSVFFLYCINEKKKVKRNQSIKCVWAHAECQMYYMYWNFRKAAPSGTNINFLNFCSNCQVVTKKKVRTWKKKSESHLVAGFFIEFAVRSDRLSESGNQINTKIDMRIGVWEKKKPHFRIKNCFNCI